MSDPLPPQQNPYAPPEAGRIAAEPSSERGGFWRDRKSVLLHREARLPDRCLRCNEPSVKRLDKMLYWHHPGLYFLILLHILIYAVVALIVRKKMKVSLPLCEAHLKRRRNGILMAWAGGLGVFLVPYALFSMSGQDGGSADTWMMLGFSSIPVMLILLVVGAFMATVAKATKIDDTYGWISAGKPFLASCPPLPSQP